MKISTIIIICFLSISYLWAEEYKNISYDWSQIVLPNNDIPLMSLITEKNELLIVGDSALYYSNDYGKTLQMYQRESGEFQIFGYQYDNENGLYLMVDNGFKNYVDLYYLKPDRDSLKAIMNIYKKYTAENNNVYYTLFTDIISNQYLVIGTQVEVWLYDIINKKYSSIKYIDDLIKNDSVGLFIDLVKVDKLSNRIDIYYSIGSGTDYHIYSNDLGITWENDSFQIDCIPFHSDIILGYAQWNKKDRWYLPNPYSKSISSIDKNCNIFTKKFSFSFNSNFWRRWYGAYIQYDFYVVDSLVIFPIFPTSDCKLMLSKDFGHNYDMIDNIPVAVDNIQFLVTQVFTDSKVLILSWNKDKIPVVYVGTPKPTSVDSKFENNNLVIYPNPAVDYIEINGSIGACSNGNYAYPNSNEASPIASDYIQIFNTLGEIVLSVEQTLPSVQRIDVSKLSPGIYFIKIGSRVEKFVKM